MARMSHRTFFFFVRFRTMLTSFKVPCMISYQPLQTSSAPTCHKVTASREPTYVTFREHYCYSPSVPVPLHDDEDTFKNGFLPPGCRIVDVKVTLSPVRHPRHFLTRYYYYYLLAGWSQYHRRKAFFQCVLRNIQARSSSRHRRSRKRRQSYFVRFEVLRRNRYHHHRKGTSVCYAHCACS